MDDTLKQLDKLSTVVQDNHTTSLRFIVSSSYHADISAGVKAESQEHVTVDDSDSDDTEEEESLAAFKKPRISNPKPDRSRAKIGTWEVGLGCEAGWWSNSVSGRDLRNLILHGDKALVNQVRGAMERKSISFSPDDSLLSFDSDTSEPIVLKLSRLHTSAALALSTRLHFNRAEPSTSQLSSHERHTLQHQLDSAKQALKEERHKYRKLLAAPSAATARAGRRPVVGLGPLPRASQSQSQVQMPSSSSGLSSSPAGAGPSSDGLEMEVGGKVVGGTRQSQGQSQSRSQSQRTMSLVNPTRVVRADPSRNNAFVGDSDDEFV